jgi:hypothetical protein
MFGLMITLSAMKKLPVKIGLRCIGATLVAFGGYFVFSLLYYYYLEAMQRIQTYGMK